MRGFVIQIEEVALVVSGLLIFPRKESKVYL